MINKSHCRAAAYQTTARRAEQARVSPCDLKGSLKCFYACAGACVCVCVCASAGISLCARGINYQINRVKISYESQTNHWNEGHRHLGRGLMMNSLSSLGVCDNSLLFMPGWSSFSPTLQCFYLSWKKTLQIIIRSLHKLHVKKASRLNRWLNLSSCFSEQLFSSILCHQLGYEARKIMSLIYLPVISKVHIVSDKPNAINRAEIAKNIRPGCFYQLNKDSFYTLLI